MADKILLLDTALDAISFADDMVNDRLWQAGRGKAKAERFARVGTLIALGETLRLEILRAERAGRPTEHVKQMVSDVALELSTLCRVALSDKSYRNKHFDPWVLTHVREEDDCRRENIVPRLALAA